MGSKGSTPRTLVCDTNVIVRLLTGDPPHQTEAAVRAFQEAAAGRIGLILPDVVVAEAVYALTSVYRLPKKGVADRMRDVVELEGIVAADEALLVHALQTWGARPVDFADAYLSALSLRIESSGVLSFDRDYEKVPGVVRVDPARVASTIQE